MFIQINTLPFAEKIFEIIVCKKKTFINMNKNIRGSTIHMNEIANQKQQRNFRSRETRFKSDKV